MPRLAFGLGVAVAVAGCPSCESIELICDGAVCVVGDGGVSTGGGSTAGGRAGGASGGLAGGLSGGSAGGVSGGLSGGSAGGVSGGLSGGSAGGASGGVSGGAAGGVSGGSAGGSSGGMSGGSAGGTSGGAVSGGSSGGGSAGGTSGGAVSGGSSGGMSGGSAGGAGGGCAPSDGGLFVFAHSGYCLGTLNGRVEPGNQLFQTRCDAGVRVVEEPTAFGVRLRLPQGLCSDDGNPPLTKACCVDLPNANPINPLVVWVCHPDAHSSWQTSCLAPGQRSFQTAAPAGTCIEVSGTALNQSVMTGSCTGAANQQVSILP